MLQLYVRLLGRPAGRDRRTRDRGGRSRCSASLTSASSPRRSVDTSTGADHRHPRDDADGGAGRSSGHPRRVPGGSAECVRDDRWRRGRGADDRGHLSSPSCWPPRSTAYLERDSEGGRSIRAVASRPVTSPRCSASRSGQSMYRDLGAWAGSLTADVASHHRGPCRPCQYFQMSLLILSGLAAALRGSVPRDPLVTVPWGCFVIGILGRAVHRRGGADARRGRGRLRRNPGDPGRY